MDRSTVQRNPDSAESTASRSSRVRWQELASVVVRSPSDVTIVCRRPQVFAW